MQRYTVCLVSGPDTGYLRKQKPDIYRCTRTRCGMINCYAEIQIIFLVQRIPREMDMNLCTVGWVNLYQKFEIEKYTFCGKLILPKKMERHLKKIFFATTGLQICMDLRIFASFLYPTLLKICTQTFDRKQFYSSTLNFVIICIAKKKCMCYQVCKLFMF